MLKVVREKYGTKEYGRAKNNFGIIVTNEHKTDNELFQKDYDKNIVIFIGIKGQAGCDVYSMTHKIVTFAPPFHII